MANDQSLENSTNRSTNYHFVSNDSQTSWLLFFFRIFILLCAALIIIGFYYYIYYPTELNTQLNQDNEKVILQILSPYYIVLGLSGLSYIFCGIIFLFWIYRASNNTHALNPEVNIEFTPGWMVGSYFLPIVNLYWPYKSMKELWRINTKNSNDSIIMIWWITFLLLNLTAPISSVIAQSANYQLTIHENIFIDNLSNIFGIISALLAIKIIIKIHAAQK